MFMNRRSCFGTGGFGVRRGIGNVDHEEGKYLVWVTPMRAVPILKHRQLIRRPQQLLMSFEVYVSGMIY